MYRENIRDSDLYGNNNRETPSVRISGRRGECWDAAERFPGWIKMEKVTGGGKKILESCMCAVVFREGSIMLFCVVAVLKKKSRQHPDFPGGHPPEYYPSLRLLNFAERTGYGVLSLRWPSTTLYPQQSHVPLSALLLYSRTFLSLLPHAFRRRDILHDHLRAESPIIDCTYRKLPPCI